MSRIGLNLPSELTHQDAQVLGLIVPARVPDRLQDGSVGQHPAGMCGEQRDQLEFLGCQPDFELAAMARRRSKSIVRSPRAS